MCECLRHEPLRNPFERLGSALPIDPEVDISDDSYNRHLAGTPPARGRTARVGRVRRFFERRGSIDR